MNNFDFKRMLWWLLFAIFGLISCYLTGNSLYLTFDDPSLPQILFFVVAAGLFVLTSICTTWIIAGFSREYVEKRYSKLFGGLIGFVLLWLVFSMPTNTHSLFYNRMATDVATQEMLYYKGEIGKLTDPEVAVAKFIQEWVQDSARIRNMEIKYKGELEDPTNYGAGSKSVSKLQDIERELNAPDNTLLYKTATTQMDVNAIYKHNHNLISNLLETERGRRYTEMRSKLKNFNKEAAGIRKTIVKIDKELAMLQMVKTNKGKTIDKGDVLRAARGLSLECYSIINPDKEYAFLDRNSVQPYKGMSSKNLMSVVDVWKALLSHSRATKGYGLVYMVLISIMVDLSAFLFFNLARKEEDYF